MYSPNALSAWLFITYSYFNASTGFAVAALIA
jgi:hypothetical protein